MSGLPSAGYATSAFLPGDPATTRLNNQLRSSSVQPNSMRAQIVHRRRFARKQSLASSRSSSVSQKSASSGGKMPQSALRRKKARFNHKNSILAAIDNKQYLQQDLNNIDFLESSNVTSFMKRRKGRRKRSSLLRQSRDSSASSSKQMFNKEHLQQMLGKEGSIQLLNTTDDTFIQRKSVQNFRVVDQQQ